MTDALDALGIPVEPIDPDPSFAARLRRQLQDALLTTTTPTTGGDMTHTQEITYTAAPMHEAAEHDTAAWPPTLTPYISVSDARHAIDWYVEVFGARPRGDIYEGSDGSIGHAELAIGDAVLMLSDPWLDGGVGAPEPGRTHSHSLHLQVDDVDGTVRRAADEGAVIERQPEDQPYGRVATLLDPFGHRWMLNQPPPSATRVAHGDIGYVTLSTRDAERAKAFYGAVLGWQFTRGNVPGGWQIEGRTPMMGLHGDPANEFGASLVYRVADIAAAIERVRAAGGEADEAQLQPYGLLAYCTDDQGASFDLWQPDAVRRESVSGRDEVVTSTRQMTACLTSEFPDRSVPETAKTAANSVAPTSTIVGPDCTSRW